MDRRRRWQLVQDGALAALIGAVGLAEIWVPFDSVQGQGSPALASVAVVAVAIVLVFRRIRPLVLAAVPAVWVVAAVAAGGEILILFFGQLVPLYTALYTAARHAVARDMAIVVGAIAATVVLADLTQPPLQGPSEMLFHWAVFLAVFGVGWGLRASERRAVSSALRAAEAEAAAREAVMRATAAERTRIARELHDILGHSVSVMVVQAGAASQAVADDPAFVARALESIRTTGAEALAEVRRVVALLRDDGEDRDPQPDLDRVAGLVDLARDAGLDVDFRREGDGSALAAGVQLAAYRIVQEALTNVRKHSDARHVELTLRTTDAAIEISVVDDGGRAPHDVVASPQSADAQPSRDAAPSAPQVGHGLIGMQERAVLYGGTVAAGPRGDGREGWAVRARIPAGVAVGRTS